MQRLNLAALDQNQGGTKLSFFEHDNQQTTLDLGPKGAGPGDQFIYAGYLFDHAGGRQVGSTAGQCTTVSGNATAPGDVFCTATFVLGDGQITTQGLVDSTALFRSGKTLPMAIVGGTGRYQNARGEGTVQVPPNVPNDADANFTINLTG